MDMRNPKQSMYTKNERPCESIGEIIEEGLLATANNLP